MRIRFLSLLSLLALILSGRAARADYQFLFTDSSGNASTSFSVAQGATVDIRVYLLQSGTDTGLSSQGLNAAGVGLSYNQAVANLASAAAITPNAAFDFASKSVGSGTATLNLAQDISGPVLAPTAGTDANRILLGSFSFTGVSGGSTLIQTADPNPSISNNVLADGTVLDPSIIYSSAVVTVTAVPEPGTLLLTGLFAVGTVGAAWRRRRAA